MGGYTEEMYLHIFTQYPGVARGIINVEGEDLTNTIGCVQDARWGRLCTAEVACNIRHYIKHHMRQWVKFTVGRTVACTVTFTCVLVYAHIQTT